MMLQAIKKNVMIVMNRGIDTMKKLMLIVGILAMATVPAIAAVPAKETMSVPYLRNYGYSEATNLYIQKQKAMSNGREYYANIVDPSAHYRGKFQTIINGTRSFFDYIDPALDADNFLNKDIKFYSTTNDTY